MSVFLLMDLTVVRARTDGRGGYRNTEAHPFKRPK